MPDCTPEGKVERAGMGKGEERKKIYKTQETGLIFMGKGRYTI